MSRRYDYITGPKGRVRRISRSRAYFPKSLTKSAFTGADRAAQDRAEAKRERRRQRDARRD